MNFSEQYYAYLKRQEDIKNGQMGHIWTDQHKRYVKPFKIYENIYYVGDSWVCIHLIDTGDGLLLIDAGNCAADAMLIQSIWESGFNPADIKWIILSHGHVDHFGAATLLRDMFGSKIYLGEPDALMFKEAPGLSFIQDSPDIMASLFEPDEVINDGQIIKFGDIEIEFYLVPGHTMGTIAFFFDINGINETKRVGYYGGFGFNTLQKDHLIEIGDNEYKTRDTYLESLAKVRNQKVDIFLGNHTNNNNTLEKLEEMKKNPDKNPFVDTEIWGNYLDEKRDSLLEFMKDPKNN